MKIIIVGIGKIGRIVTEYLANEGHDIVVVDIDAAVVQEAVDTYDVRGVVGNGANYDIQVQAEAERTDALIAVTESDELNLLCCLVAQKNGVKHTIARVRNPEYGKQIDFMHDDLGLNMIINPELEAASEIMKILRFPSALNIDTFAQGKAEIVEIKVPEESILVGKTLSALGRELEVSFLVCAVVRDGTVHIPSGGFVLRAGDHIHITAAASEIGKFFRKLKILRQRARKIMLIGGSKISYYLARELSESRLDIKIIEKDRERARELGERLPGVAVICGDGTNQEILREEGILDADAFVTLTGNDEENIILSLYAKTLEVPKIITKVNHISYYNILEKLDLGTIISPKALTANQILRYVRSLSDSITSEVKTLYKLVNNQIEAAEFYIPAETDYTGIKFRDLSLKKDILIGCIVRNKTVIIPHGEDYFRAGDSVIIVSTRKLKDLEDILSG